MQSPAQLLGSDGPLVRQIANFAPRLQQQEMAEAVAQALAGRDTFICEAGTGTGKTFAYLVPVLQSGRRVIISTGTRNLQDQLYHRDLPLVREALGVPVTVALLKGRSNYLCRHRLELAEQRPRPGSREETHDVTEVRAWAGRTVSGDIAELAAVPENSTVWPAVTSTRENCVGQECAYFSDCFVVKARRAAQEADVVVINHHLFFADMALREEGFGEVLPGADAFILDEAHQLPDVASRYFGMTLSSRQLQELAADTLAEQVQNAGDMAEIREAAERLNKAVLDLRLACPDEDRRGAWRELVAKAEVRSALTALGTALDELERMLEQAAPRAKSLEACWRRALEQGERLALMAADTPVEYVQWYEVKGRRFAITLSPMDIAEPFHRYTATQQAAWVFTSATLAVGDSFAFFKDRMGVEAQMEQRWDSPFEYERQALLYLPTGLPDPNSPAYTDAVIEAALPVVAASHGGTFFLFTSHRALRHAARGLQNRLDYPLLVQGSAPRDELLDRFRQLGNAVLLGTSSFWEGVDVRGEALSAVIIDRLPFAPPDDPVLQARIEAMREQGANPFIEYQLPNAVIALKQGVGRLIRDVHDRGVMMLCDPRIVSKPYGRVFIKSLPPMRSTRELADVVAFFRAMGAEGVASSACNEATE